MAVVVVEVAFIRRMLGDLLHVASWLEVVAGFSRVQYRALDLYVTHVNAGKQPAGQSDDNVL